MTSRPGPPGAQPCQRGLRVTGLTVRFGGKAAVNDVSLSLAPGHVLALLGASGCGKSTLLRAIAGLIEPAGRAIEVEGSVSWDGQDLTRVPVHRRGFGLMFQSGELFTHLDVAANTGYGLKVAKMPRARREKRVAQMLELVGLSGFDHRRVATLSGGEAQRVALARALAPGPRLLLLDEPLSALDRTRRERLAAQMRAILVAAGATAIFVTHDAEEAMTMAGQIAIMADGKILQHGDAETIWYHPQTPAAARLVGFRDFLPGQRAGWTISGQWGRAELSPAVSPWARHEASSPQLSGQQGPGAGPHPAVLAIRPGALQASGDGPLRAKVAGPARTVSAGRVQECELPGGIMVPVVVPDEQPAGRVIAAAIRPEMAALLPG